MTRVENLYSDDRDGLQHEIGFYYRVPWPGDPHDHATDTAEPDHRFRWATIDTLDKINFKPPELVPSLKNLDSSPRHIVLDRRRTHE